MFTYIHIFKEPFLDFNHFIVNTVDKQYRVGDLENRGRSCRRS